MLAATISCKSLRGSKPVAEMMFCKPGSFAGICESRYCPNGEVCTWSTRTPETALAPGITKPSNVGSTAAKLAEAVKTKIRAAESFMWLLMHHSTNWDGREFPEYGDLVKVVGWNC